MIPQRNISLLSNRLAGKGGRRIPEAVLELDFRNRTTDDLGAVYDRKEARLKKLWNNRLSTQMVELPQFDNVFRIVRRAVKGAGWL